MDFARLQAASDGALLEEYKKLDVPQANASYVGCAHLVDNKYDAGCQGLFGGAYGLLVGFNWGP